MSREIVSYMARLEDLAHGIRREHAEAVKNLKFAVMHAIAAGKSLIEAKKQLKHGEWLPWLEQNCEFSERTARGYMRLARLSPEKGNAVADLPLREALAALAKPREHDCPANTPWEHEPDCELAALEPYVAVCCGAPVRRVCACDSPYQWENSGEICAVPRDHPLARRWVCN
jgi:hypothetical protein